MANPFVTVVERDEDVVHLLIRTGSGDVTVMANERVLESTLELNRVHVEGPGLNPSIIRNAARFLAGQAGARTVIIRGSVRTSGVRPGRVPRPLRIEVSK